MNLIVAVDENWGIGRNGDLLVRIPEDQAFFRQITSGKIVVMGHATFKSLPRSEPLKNRVNIVLTSNPKVAIQGAVVCHSLPDLLKICSTHSSDDVFVIGGQSVYEQLLPYCVNAYVTKFWPAQQSADRFFPNLDEHGDWTLAERSQAQQHNDLSYAFLRYVNAGATAKHQGQ